MGKDSSGHAKRCATLRAEGPGCPLDEMMPWHPRAEQPRRQKHIHLTDTTEVKIFIFSIFKTLVPQGQKFFQFTVLTLQKKKPFN